MNANRLAEEALNRGNGRRGIGIRLACEATLWLDDNAAGWGWFVDPTPGGDSDFTTPSNQGEQHRRDLLTEQAHEIGQVLGYDHTDAGLRSPTLDSGLRETPRTGFDQVVATW
jgi:hypothetical protein